MYYRFQCFTLSTAILFFTFPVVTALGAREPEQRLLDTTKLQVVPDNKQDNLQLYPKIAGVLELTTPSSTELQQQFKDSLRNFKDNLYKLQETLNIQRKKRDRIGEADSLNKIGHLYFEYRDYNKALNFYQSTLKLYDNLNYKSKVVETIGSVSDVYFQIGEYSKIEQLLNQRLETFEKFGDKMSQKLLLAVMQRHMENRWGLAAGSGFTNNIEIQERLHEGTISWQEVLEISKLNLFVAKELKVPKFRVDCLSIHSILHGIGWSYRNLGQYSQALDYYHQALEYAKKSNDKHSELLYQIEIGFVYSDLGQYDKALEIIKTTLAIVEKDKLCRCMGLSKLGLVYKEMGQYDKALPVLKEALSMNGDSEKENILNYIGDIYFKTGGYSEALNSYEHATKVYSIAGEYDSKGFTFNNIGLVYTQMGNYSKASEAYNKALTLFKNLNNNPGEKEVLINIGTLLEKQKCPELATVFYKEAVNITEDIRKDLRELTHKEQEAYTNKVAQNYRHLADLLLSQGRILEAQQVLELLKTQEIKDFTKDTAVRGENAKLTLSHDEQKIIDKYGSLISFGNQVYECQRNNCSQLSTLNAQLEVLNQQYNENKDKFISAIRERKGKDDAFFDPRRLINAQKIVEAQPGTVLIYPFVLSDKVWLLWISRGGVVKSVEIQNTGQLQLGKEVLEFRQLIDNKNSDISQVKATGKKLYDLLIKPLEAELKANNVQNLVFALDSVTRYIPMSALYDGQNYLVENYNISTVLSVELTNTDDRLPIGIQNNPVLALGLSNAVAGFPALPNVPAELQAIVKTNAKTNNGIFPGLEFINQNFNRAVLRDRVNGRKILHIATHGQFVPNNFLASFILLGTGEKFTTGDIRNLPSLGDVHLVVLSACQTALGDAMQDGVEISSISYYFLNRGAKAVMSSLWLVDDQSTSELMKYFYSNLAKSTTQTPVTKAFALRQAQLTLMQTKISTNKQVTDPRGGGITTEPLPGASTKVKRTQDNFSHPYYWAPFILIGNGL